ncbi:AAA family ATPase [Bradyrhizobium diazoefficiens]
MKAFPPFRLDVENQCLWRMTDGKGERVLMTPKAFAVLAYLVENAGRLVRNDELLDFVWAGTTVEPQAVKKHIAAVRNALGDPPKNSRFIETSTKRGYRFIAPIVEVAAAEISPIDLRTRATFVGRVSALNELAERWRCVLSSTQQIVLVSGEAGIGKTAVAEEFRRQIAATEISVCISQGQCVEGYGSKEPYGPVLDAFSRLCRGAHAQTVLPILATEAPTWLAQLPSTISAEQRQILEREIVGATRERMMREIADALLAISNRHPLLLVLEDMQWTDASTVDLISYLARRRAPARLMILMTCRELELVPSDNPLKALIPELVVHRLCHKIDLPPLSGQNIETYLQNQASGGELPHGFVDFLHRHSEGNPLFLVAALEDLKKRRLLSLSGDIWRLRVAIQELELVVPDDLRLMIAARLDRLPAREIDALERASVVGASFSALAVVDKDGPGPQTVEDLYDGLARRHRLVRWIRTQSYPDDSRAELYEFAHALYRQVIYERLGPNRKAALHRLVGERLEAIYSTRIDDVVSELAYHFERAGDTQRCIEYLRLSAETAGRRRAHAEAASILLRAIQMVPHLPEGLQPSTEAQLLAALAAHRMAAFDPEAVATYEALAGRAAELNLVDVQVRALLDLSFYQSLTSAKQCLEVIDRVLVLSGRQEPRLRAQTRAACAFRRLSVTGWNAADAEAFFAGHQDVGIENAPLHDLVDMSMIHWFSGGYRKGLQLALEVRSRMFEPGATPDLADFEMAGALAAANRLFLGEWGEALDGLAEELAVARRNENPHRTMWAHCTLAWVHLHTLDFEGVLRICRAGAPFLDTADEKLSGLSAGVPALTRAALICMGSAAAELGDLTVARRYLLRASRDMDENPVITDWYWRMQLEAGLVRLNLAAGDRPAAELAVRRLVAQSEVTVERTWQALAWELSARVAMAEGDADRALNCITKALAKIEGFEGPLAAWRVNATAAELYGRTADREISERHREASRETLRLLSRSLQKHTALQSIFLAAPEVTRTFDAGAEPQVI